MNSKLTFFNLRQKAYRFVEVGIYPLIAFMFLLLMGWQIYSVVEIHQELNKERTSRDALSAKLEKYRENAKISDQDRMVYGTIIARQIPATDNTFNTYALMESFYETTGIELTPARSTTASARSRTAIAASTNLLQASTTLTSQQLKDVLDTYQYQFPRFMTLNAITVARNIADPDTFDVDFNFEMHSLAPEGKKPETSGASGIQFTASDKRNFDHYINNTNVDLYYETISTTPVDTEYEPAGSIF